MRRPACRVRRGGVTVALTDAGSLGPVRVAYSVGRSVGTSVRRNRIRRRLRAVVGEAYRGGELGPGSYLVSVGHGAASMSFRELRAATRDAFRAARPTGDGMREQTRG
ncbi:MAG: ribonuclease P protein component [Acidimicrobiales bacterium]|nr:ribonuclease P protein component [Acidimicrobiales bacterium]